MKNLKASLILTAAIVMSMASVAQGQIEKPQPMGYVGLLGGYADPGSLKGRFGYGADVGLKFTNGWTGLLFYQTSKAEEDGIDTAIHQYGIGADYALSERFQGDMGVLGAMKVGLRMGSGTVEATGPGLDTNESAFTYGLAVGYDHRLERLEGFGLSAELQNLWSNWDDNESVLYLLAGLKYWF